MSIGKCSIRVAVLLATITVPLALAQSAADAASGNTTTTFTVNGGALAISVPASVALGSGNPGASISAQLGAVTVTDTRALLTATWTTTVTTSSFTTGGATTPETIPITAISYWSGAATSTTGSGTFTPGQANAGAAAVLSTGRTAFALTGGVGNNTASWNPTIVIAVPAAAVNGTYTGTITHSVA